MEPANCSPGKTSVNEEEGKAKLAELFQKTGRLQLRMK
jgi:hypothetical protein